MISFSELAIAWLDKLDAATAEESTAAPAAADETRWKHIRRFFEYVEANGEEFLRPPRFELGRSRSSNGGRSSEIRSAERKPGRHRRR